MTTHSEPQQPAVDAGRATMRAIVRDHYGSAEVLRLDDVTVPEPRDREVLVRVHAAGLDRGTWHLMTGKPYALRLGFGLRRPRNPVAGREVSGTVAAVGPAVTRFAPGDEVYGIAPGSFAEYAVGSEDKLAAKPRTLDFVQAAALPVSGLTALQALTDVGRLEAGQRVLVLGASGGVGSLAVQLAAAMGATVTGVCSPAKADLVLGLGADHVLDRTRDDFADRTRTYDLVVDLAGNPSVSRLCRALAPAGTAVLAGGEEGGVLTGGMGRQLRALARSAFGRKRLTGMLCKERAADLERLADLVDVHAISPAIDSVVPLEGARDAMLRLEAGDVRGKVVLTV